MSNTTISSVLMDVGVVPIMVFTTGCLFNDVNPIVFILDEGQISIGISISLIASILDSLKKRAWPKRWGWDERISSVSL